MKLVDVCINLPLKKINKTFTYQLPEKFAQADVGWRVVVPFAGNTAEAFILRKYSGSYQQGELKEISEVLEETPWFNGKMLALAKWLADYYLCTLAEIMRLFLPGKKSLLLKTNYVFNPEFAQPLTDAEEKKLFCFFREHLSLTKEQFVKLTGSWPEQIIANLVKRGAIKKEKNFHKKFKKVKVDFAKVTCQIDKYLADNPKCPKAREKALLLFKENQTELAVSFFKKQGINRDTLLRMQKNGLLEIKSYYINRNSYKDIAGCENKIVLNHEQLTAIEEVAQSAAKNEYQPFLLYGVTGSGKTQVYLEAAQKAYKQGKQVLMLVPEIALTGQTIRRFKEHFAENLLVFHSRLSVNERMDVFEQVKTGEPCVLIGVRSAVFAPFAKLGLVIMDEEHEYSYKQEERPGYQAKVVAQKLCELSQVPLVFGSATPSIETYFKALSGEYKLLKLTQRPLQTTMPEVELVDMRQELQEGNKGVISKALATELAEMQKKKEQVIILLNRRGYSTFVLCRDCGYVEKCEHCAVSLVYHQKDLSLRCHYCGYTKQVPLACPKCKSRKIKFFGSGTQKAEEQLSQHFSQLKIIRMDQDTTTAKMGHDKILEAFKEKKYDLLLGTQMVAKGHDVPAVTLVGVLSADALLNLPDFRACERTFALLTQAAGRAGRGDKKGKVILQVYEKEHPVLGFVQNHDYNGFYKYEINERKELFYPPFCQLLKITVTGKSEVAAMQKAQVFVKQLRTYHYQEELSLLVNGPFLSLVKKVKDIYKAIIILKTDRAELLKKVLLDTGINADKDTLIDIDPLNVI